MDDIERFNEIKERRPCPPFVDNDDDIDFLINRVDSLMAVINVRRTQTKQPIDMERLKRHTATESDLIAQYCYVVDAGYQGSLEQFKELLDAHTKPDVQYARPPSPSTDRPIPKT